MPTKKQKSSHPVAEPHTLARPRKLKQRSPTRKSDKSKRTSNVAATIRVQQFPDECLVAVGDDLLCKACNNKPLTNMGDSIKKHIKSAAHAQGKVNMIRRAQRQQALERYFSKLQMDETRQS